MTDTNPESRFVIMEIHAVFLLVRLPVEPINCGYCSVQCKIF